MVKIGILIHANEFKFLHCQFLINSLIRIWAKENYKITIIKGATAKPDIDILINHVDMTVVPEEYLDLMNNYPRVINGRVKDISKREVSTNLLEKNSKYSGMVIVKPNLNAGGAAEMAKSIPNGLLHLQNELANLKNNLTYSLYDSLEKVPDHIFSNNEFVVEKFLPEKENDTYYLRVCSFLGDKYVCSRVGSKEAIIKGASVISRELVEPPKEIIESMKKRKFDYGKFDFCIHNGEIILFDTNKTPGYSPHNADNAKVLSEGIRAFL